MMSKPKASAESRTMKNQWAGRPCKLNVAGRSFEARIGTAEDGRFAAILTFNPPLPAVQFSWAAVERIMLNDGIFQL